MGKKYLNHNKLKCIFRTCYYDSYKHKSVVYDGNIAYSTSIPVGSFSFTNYPISNYNWTQGGIFTKEEIIEIKDVLDIK